MDYFSAAAGFMAILSLATHMLELLQRLEAATKGSVTMIMPLVAEISALRRLLKSLEPLIVVNELDKSIIPINLFEVTRKTLYEIKEVIGKPQSDYEFSRVIRGNLQRDRIEHLRKELVRQNSSFALI